MKMLKKYQAILYLFLGAYVTCVAGLDFTGANWIWSAGANPDGTYPPGDVALRRSFFAPKSKAPVSAKILIITDDEYTLYVNGLELGSGGLDKAQRYCVPLVKGHNVFAVAGRNLDIPSFFAGVLAAIEIKYLDGSTETIVTDEQWRAVTEWPAGFEQVAFDDSQWPAATISVGPGPPDTVPIPPDNQITPRPLDFDSAYWFWTNETTGSTSGAPVGARAFRRKIQIPNGQLAAQARFLIAADDEYTLYVNGHAVASATQSAVVHRYLVNFPPTDLVVIAVYGVNTVNNSPAGLVLAAEIVTCDCADNVDVVSNGLWKYSISIPPDFIESDYKDKTWPRVFVEGREGIQPWGDLPIPSSNSPGSPPLDGAPPAPPASVVT